MGGASSQLSSSLHTSHFTRRQDLPECAPACVHVAQSEDSAQAVESMKLQRLNVFSMPALQRNLEEFETFLDNHSLDKHLNFIK